MKATATTLLLAYAAILVFFTSCHGTLSQTSFPAQHLVDDVVAVQPTAGHKQLLAMMRGVAVTNKFDPNFYFGTLNKLRPDTGYVLDWVYCTKETVGLPVLYARRADQQPFAAFGNYAAYTTNRVPNTALSSADAESILRFGYIEQLQVEDSPEGYFQLVVLRLLGDRFYMFWHEYYDETFLVCSKSAWQRLVEKEKTRGSSYRPPPPSFIAAADKVNFTPRVQIRRTEAVVEVTTYNPFSGLDAHSFTIARQYPHSILKHTHTNLLEHTQPFFF